MRDTITQNVRVLQWEEPGQVKTKVLMEALSDIVVEQRKLGWDRGGAPDLVVYRRQLMRNEQFLIALFNDKLPEPKSLISSKFIEDHADSSFFEGISSFSQKPIVPPE